MIPSTALRQLVHNVSDAPNERPELDRLLAGYGAAAAGFDEMLAADGTVRPHWRAFVDRFAAMGAEGRTAAGESTRRLLRESGIAFNVYADPDDRAHAWRLDLVPVILPDAEWDRLAAGILQRARLIDAVLADLHGPQRLLHDGSLPASLLLGSPAFVRTSVDRESPGRRFLYAYACDVARTASGEWVVLGDQTATAIGNGYVLASRVALSHGLAQLFRDCRTRRLAGYFLGVQEAFQGLCRRDDGRIVIMSPGPASPSYFSHAYLARYLGYTVVESGDLTVRDNQLYLKTLDGLQRVYLVVAKQPGHLMDPLHLPGTGLAGIPGLVQAARSGNVAMVNRPGSGVVQNHALAPFAERLFRQVLGEAPLLGDLPTRWLGAPGAATEVMGEPERWALVEATARNDPGEPSPIVGPGPLTAPARRTLEGRLAAEAHRWVAIEPVTLATTPAFDGERFVPTPFAVRTFVVATENGYRILPGGMVRLAGAPTAPTLPNGFGSKDLWVSAVQAEREAPSILRTSMREVHLRRTGRDLLSRTADNLYWLGRYSERAEGTMRLLRSVLSRFLEDGRPDSSPEVLQRLLQLQLKQVTPPDEKAVEASWDGVEELVRVLMHDQRSYALRDSLEQVHRTATLVRDQISHDAWRMLNAIHVDRRWRQPKGAGLTWPMLELLDEGIRALNAFSGTEAENMTRNFAWRFLELGRRIERARQLTEFTRALVCAGPEPENDGSLRLLLELGDSFMTYRSRYLMTPLTAPVLDLLLLDETNPRGIAFQLAKLDAHFELLPSEGPHRSPGQRLILKLLTSVRLAEVEELCQHNEDGKLERLETLLDALIDGLPQLSDLIGRSYFAHAEMPVATLIMGRRDEP